MSVWWIDGIKDDAELAKALRQEAEEAIESTVHDLLVYAADRLDALSAEKSKP
jgi:hypothetical protein